MAAASRSLMWPGTEKKIPLRAGSSTLVTRLRSYPDMSGRVVISLPIDALPFLPLIGGGLNDANITDIQNSVTAPDGFNLPDDRESSPTHCGVEVE